MNTSGRRLPPVHWTPHAWPAVVAGLFWLCGNAGMWSLLLGLLPGCLLLASGIGLLMWPGDTRITSGMALGAVVGLLMALPALWVLGWQFAAAGAIFSVLSFVAAGREAQRQIDLPEELCGRRGGWRTDLKAALDEALVGYFVFTAKIPSGDQLSAICDEIKIFEHALSGIQQSGRVVPSRSVMAPDDVRITKGRSLGHTFDVVEFESGYQPPLDLPGSPAWLDSPSNRRCRLRVFRQPQGGRRWLLGIHGYRMGADWLDLQLFRPRELVDGLGLNLVLPTLPLHGSRRCGFRSGDHFLDGRLLGVFFAEAQALWDLQRALAWIRSQDPGARVGVLGYSLGGYNAALLAAYEDNLDFVVAGVPVAEFSSLIWQSLPRPHRSYLAAAGLTQARYAALLDPVSPLTCPPRLSSERLAIFAGGADHVVPPAQAIRLARHWHVPVRWYFGGHVTFSGESVVNDTLQAMMRVAGWNSGNV